MGWVRKVTRIMAAMPQLRDRLSFLHWVSAGGPAPLPAASPGSSWARAVFLPGPAGVAGLRLLPASASPHFPLMPSTPIVQVPPTPDVSSQGWGTPPRVHGVGRSRQPASSPPGTVGQAPEQTPAAGGGTRIRLPSRLEAVLRAQKCREPRSGTAQPGRSLGSRRSSSPARRGENGALCGEDEGSGGPRETPRGADGCALSGPQVGVCGGREPCAVTAPGQAMGAGRRGGPERAVRAPAAAEPSRPGAFGPGPYRLPSPGVFSSPAWVCRQWRVRAASRDAQARVAVTLDRHRPTCGLSPSPGARALRVLGAMPKWGGSGFPPRGQRVT